MPRSRRPTGPIAVLVTVVLALATLLAGVPAGPSAADGDRSGPEASHEASSRHRARVVVVDHNVERRQGAVDDAMRRAARTGAAIVTLQEVCWWQARDLARAHPRWTVAWRRDADSGGCRVRDGLDGLINGRRAGLGNVVVVKRPGGTVSWHRFRAQKPRRTQGLLCVSWRSGLTVHACSTHLVHTKDQPRLVRTQRRQARQVRARTAAWVRRGHLVVLGGDFNASPRSRTMDHLYEVGGTGRFYEATRCPADLLVCRRSVGRTHDTGRAKIDYVFFSANRMDPGLPHALSILPTRSDHHLLTASAFVRTGRG